MRVMYLFMRVTHLYMRVTCRDVNTILFSLFFFIDVSAKNFFYQCFTHSPPHKSLFRLTQYNLRFIVHIFTSFRKHFSIIVLPKTQRRTLIFCMSNARKKKRIKSINQFYIRILEEMRITNHRENQRQNYLHRRNIRLSIERWRAHCIVLLNFF